MITIGLAGHIDHGKSALVRALTNMDPDRLPEEKRRGMTIDLGFSWFLLQSGDKVGIIDVPGHRDFMRNVIAGVSGVDAALVVVAADDGWMPQTEEHFQILQLLGVRLAVFALTKIDLVADYEWLDLVEEDIVRRLNQTNLEGSPIVHVDSVSGRNMSQMREMVEQLAFRAQRKPDIGKARLPVDRIFTIRGIGTVVTGTLLDGCLSKDQQVFVSSLRGSRRIRSLEIHKQVVGLGKSGVPGRSESSRG